MSNWHSPSELENWACYQDFAKAPASDPVQTVFKTNPSTAPQPFDSHPLHADSFGIYPVHSDSFGSSITTQQALQFHYSRNANQELVQPHFSANVNIDPPLIGVTTIPRHQSAPIVTGPSLGSISALETNQGSSNVHTLQPRRSSEPLLQKNAFGYVEPAEAWKRCIQKPPLPTEEFRVQFFPPDDAPLRNENEHRCQVQAKVTTTGRGVWEYSDGPCNAVLKSGDSYRRHVVLCHLGCRRGKENKLVNWIVDRWVEHDLSLFLEIKKMDDVWIRNSF